MIGLALKGWKFWLEKDKNCMPFPYDGLRNFSLADDMVVLASSPEDLQNSLDYLYNYCNNWSLSFNTDKTQIVTFRKRGKRTLFS